MGFFSNIYHIIDFRTKNGSDLCNFYSKLDFFKFFIRNIFCFCSVFELLMFHNNTVKISEILNK